MNHHEEFPNFWVEVNFTIVCIYIKQISESWTWSTICLYSVKRCIYRSGVVGEQFGPWLKRRLKGVIWSWHTWESVRFSENHLNQWDSVTRVSRAWDVTRLVLFETEWFWILLQANWRNDSAKIRLFPERSVVSARFFRYTCMMLLLAVSNLLTYPKPTTDIMSTGTCTKSQ